MYPVAFEREGEKKQICLHNVSRSIQSVLLEAVLKMLLDSFGNAIFHVSYQIFSIRRRTPTLGHLQGCYRLPFVQEENPNRRRTPTQAATIKVYLAFRAWLQNNIAGLYTCTCICNTVTNGLKECVLRLARNGDHFVFLRYFINNTETFYCLFFCLWYFNQ